MERGKFSNNSTRYARTDKGGGGFYFYATYEFFNRKKIVIFIENKSISAVLVFNVEENRSKPV